MFETGGEMAFVREAQKGLNDVASYWIGGYTDSVPDHPFPYSAYYTTGWGNNTILIIYCFCCTSIWIQQSLDMYRACTVRPKLKECSRILCTVKSKLNESSGILCTMRYKLNKLEHRGRTRGKGCACMVPGEEGAVEAGSSMLISQWTEWLTDR